MRTIKYGYGGFFGNVLEARKILAPRPVRTDILKKRGQRNWSLRRIGGTLIAT